MKIVGGMKISPFVFYSMTIREAKLAIKGHKNEMHESYISQLYATTNAIGSCFGGQKYKSIDPFDPPKESNNKTITADDVSFYRAFGIDARDVNKANNSKFKENWDELSVSDKRKLLFDSKLP
jgi:hypothetical protein